MQTVASSLSPPPPAVLVPRGPERTRAEVFLPIAFDDRGNGLCLVRGERPGAKSAVLLPEAPPASGTRLLLGTLASASAPPSAADGEGDVAVYAVETDAAAMAAPDGDTEVVPARTLFTSDEMPRDQVEMLAMAQSLLSFHRGAAFCGRCGAPTEQAADSAAADAVGTKIVRRCTVCGSKEYPRTDPVVISLVVCGDYCLLGHNLRWPVGRYSLLAGFMELGEPVEEAIAREVFEESGVVVDAADAGAVKFMSSQPWPFPRSLMLGFMVRIPPLSVRGSTDGREYSVSVPPATACNDGEVRRRPRAELRARINPRGRRRCAAALGR